MTPTMSTKTKIIGTTLGVVMVLGITNSHEPTLATAKQETAAPAAAATTEPRQRSEGEIAVRSAAVVCTAFDGTGLTTGCELSGWHSRVDVVIDMNGAEARDFCPQVPDMMRSMVPEWNAPGWTLRIFSPYSNAPIAVCGL